LRFAECETNCLEDLVPLPRGRPDGSLVSFRRGALFANAAAQAFDLAMFGYLVALDLQYNVSLFACRR